MMNKIFVLASVVTLLVFDSVIGSTIRNADSEPEERDLIFVDENVKLQQLWHEWNFCTNAVLNDFFTPMSEVVPPRVLFLSTFDDCDNLYHTRTIPIATGEQTIFFPLFFDVQVDYSDDWLLGRCGVTTSMEAEAARYSVSTTNINTMTSANFKSKLRLKVDGVKVAPIFIRDTGSCPYHLIGCRDGRTLKEYSDLAGIPGDGCDTDEFQPINGLDAYPMQGWWGKYKRNWKKGETHTFEFGIPEETSLGGPPGCFTAKYIVTAQ